MNIRSVRLTQFPLQQINFQASRIEFNRQAFHALQSTNAFILKNIGRPFYDTTNKLFNAYYDFLAQPQHIKKEFQDKGSLDNLQGYFPYGTYFAGSRTCNRFFINNHSSGIRTQTLPKPCRVVVGMEEAADNLFAFTQQFINKTVDAVETGLGIQNHALAKLFDNYTALTVTDNYLPVTQEKLLTWSQLGKLTVTDEGKPEAFLPHKDLMPLSILIYRNNQPSGLEIKTRDTSTTQSFKKIHLQPQNEHDQQAIIILGKVMEHLTDGLLEGAEHRVVLTPLQKGETFSRDAINVFPCIDPNKNPEIKPLINAPGGPYYTSTQTNTFFVKEANKYLDGEKKRTIIYLPDNALNQFPKENEITREETPSGVVYKRQ